MMVIIDFGANISAFLPNFPSNLPYLFGQISDYLFKDVAEHLTL
jgi:hypothetical protein